MTPPKISVLDMPIKMIAEYETYRADWMKHCHWPWAREIACRIVARRANAMSRRFAKWREVRERTQP